MSENKINLKYTSTPFAKQQAWIQTLNKEIYTTK